MSKRDSVPTRLFSPYDMQGMTLKNRVVMAPMTRSRATPDGVPKPIVATYYGQRAGAGLIIAEGTNISPQGQGFPNTPGIFADTHVAAWRNVVEGVHAADSRFFLQLWHVGRIAHPDSMQPGCHPLAPSAVAFERDVMTPSGLQPAPTPRAMTVDDIAQTIEDYANAARRALEAGCDGVEIHAANGYLPAQFLHETSNFRADAYGGSLHNRMRFVIEVVEACVAAIGAERVGIRFTPFGGFNGCSSADEGALYRALLGDLSRFALAYVHIVGANIAGNKTKQGADAANIPDVAALIRPLWPHTLIVGGDYDAGRAEAVLDDPGADLVAFGRDFIANPDLVERMAKGLSLAARDPDSWYGDGAAGYIDFPPYGERMW
ncbi:MAG: N-ethylmaleimide reductase [Rhodobacteraceae bacterium HLUCCA12]|nr:MAG: N-ethylmaleimide reductase [Rhodobacteraceae bacterium HLUCCA12]